MQRRVQASRRNVRAQVTPHNLREKCPKEPKHSNSKSNPRVTPKFANLSEVPEEILGCIFQEYLKLDGSPWCLVLVSEDWKRVAFSHSVLWSYLHITLEEFEAEWVIQGMNRPMRSVGCFQICTELEDVQDALARSGGALLTVHAGGMRLPKDIKKMFQVLFHPSVSSRIQELDIFLIQDENSPVDLAGPLKTGTFSQLRTLFIRPFSSFEWTHALVSRVAHTATALLDATLEMNATYLFVTPSFWGRLRSLAVHSMFDNGLILNQIIPLCTQLQELNAQWLEPLVDANALANMRDLRIQCDPSLLSAFNLSNLQMLVIHGQVSQPLHSVQEVELLQLNTLDVMSSNIDWLVKYRMPQLSSLAICTEMNAATDLIGSDGEELPRWNYVSPELQQIHLFFSQILLSAVQSLTLHSQCHEDEFVMALEAAPNVRSVQFISKGRKRFGQGVLYRLAEDGDGLVCTRLEEVTLGCTLYALSYGKTSLVKRTLAAREVMGRPLSRLDIYFQPKGAKVTKVKCVEP